jgi:hypothetical protein
MASGPARIETLARLDPAVAAGLVDPDADPAGFPGRSLAGKSVAGTGKYPSRDGYRAPSRLCIVEGHPFRNDPP